MKNIDPYQENQWDKIRLKLLGQKRTFTYVDGDMCRKCVWANTESGCIICSRPCNGKRCYKSK